MQLMAIGPNGSHLDPLLSGGVKVMTLDDFGLYPDGITSENSSEWYRLIQLLKSQGFDIWAGGYVDGRKAIWPARWADIDPQDDSFAWAGRAFKDAKAKNTTFWEDGTPNRRAAGYTSPYLR